MVLPAAPASTSAAGVCQHHVTAEQPEDAGDKVLLLKSRRERRRRLRPRPLGAKGAQEIVQGAVGVGAEVGAKRLVPKNELSGKKRQIQNIYFRDGMEHELNQRIRSRLSEMMEDICKFKLAPVLRQGRPCSRVLSPRRDLMNLGALQGLDLLRRGHGSIGVTESALAKLVDAPREDGAVLKAQKISKSSTSQFNRNKNVN